VRQAGEARPQPNKLTPGKRASTETWRGNCHRVAPPSGPLDLINPRATLHGLLTSSKSSKPRAGP